MPAPVARRNAARHDDGVQGEMSKTAEVKPGAKEVTFDVALKAGKTRMSALFTTADGKTYGAYYAYVERK